MFLQSIKVRLGKVGRYCNNHKVYCMNVFAWNNVLNEYSLVAYNTFVFPCRWLHKCISYLPMYKKSKSEIFLHFSDS